MTTTGTADAAAPPTPPPAVTVECFGVPRLLAGPRLEASGATLGDVAADLAARNSALIGRVLEDGSGWLVNGYTFVVDDRFTRDPGTPVRPGASVLLVASAAGG